MSQLRLFTEHGQEATLSVPPFSTQLLKWVGNKQRVAHQIIAHFPADYRVYYEPFLGSGAVLGTLAPERAVASDVLPPLMSIWDMLQEDPEGLLGAYSTRWEQFQADREAAYDAIKASYNANPSWADLLFLSRACYGGVVRFRRDGYMSTPVGPHKPISPASMAKRITVWRRRTVGTEFVCSDFGEVMERAGDRDIVYCDPPYSDTQSILYGAQEFSLHRLFRAIEGARDRGAFIALSIDGSKKSGNRLCGTPLPEGLFQRTVLLECGRSMLRRFQMKGETLESEVVADRLALTW
jgi:DNA adenine methylase